jgi:hypothetical protein
MTQRQNKDRTKMDYNPHHLCNYSQEYIKIGNNSRGFDPGRAVHHNENEAILAIQVVAKSGGLEPPALQEIALGMDQCNGVSNMRPIFCSGFKEPPCEMELTHKQGDRNFTLPVHRARYSRAKENQDLNSNATNGNFNLNAAGTLSASTAVHTDKRSGGKARRAGTRLPVQLRRAQGRTWTCSTRGERCMGCEGEVRGKER